MGYWVYFLASRRYGTLYVGVTNDLAAWMQHHRIGQGSKFVKQYCVTQLVYVERYEIAIEAIAREKQIKKWNREWKIRLIEKENLDWRDLSDLIVE